MEDEQNSYEDDYELEQDESYSNESSCNRDSDESEKVHAPVEIVAVEYMRYESSTRGPSSSRHRSMMLGPPKDAQQIPLTYGSKPCRTPPATTDSFCRLRIGAPSPPAFSVALYGRRSTVRTF